jgi:hypothetical protein
MIIFENVPDSALPVYSSAPDMYLCTNLKPVIFKTGNIPPRVEFSKLFDASDIYSALSSESGSLANKEMDEDIDKIANAFIEVGMKTVIVSLYPRFATIWRLSDRR